MKTTIDERIKKVCDACRRYVFDYYDLSEKVTVRHTVIKKQSGFGKNRKVDKLVFRIEIEMIPEDLKLKDKTRQGGLENV